MFVVIRKRKEGITPGVYGFFHSMEACQGWVDTAFKDNHPELCQIVPLELVRTKLK